MVLKVIDRKARAEAERIIVKRHGNLPTGGLSKNGRRKFFRYGKLPSLRSISDEEERRELNFYLGERKRILVDEVIKPRTFKRRKKK